MTLTSSYSNRNFKLIEVSGVITVYGDEFLHVINNDKKNNDQKYRAKLFKRGLALTRG